MSLSDDPVDRIAKAQAIWRAAYRWGLAIVALHFAVALYYAQALWPLTHVPMHWDINGHINRYGSGKESGGIMIMLACLSLFVISIIRFVTRTGPRLEGMAATPRLLGAVFIFVPLLLTGVTAMVGSLSLADAPFDKSIWQMRAIFVGAGLLVAITGNFLGKTRRNWYIGVRTPWSLSSDAAWAKSNRVAGRGMVLTGAATILAALFAPPLYGGIVLGIGSAIMAVSAVYTSWATWRDDPKRIA